MGETELTSFIGWVDLSEDDQKRARDYLRSLSEGTLDELGFGIIRDTFADRFFPATSTIMTRARYFILVPSTYLFVLNKGLQGERAKKKCNEIEHNLRVSLIDNGSIENWRTEEVKRYPASIYWAGLRRLKIYQQEGSQANYFNKLASYFDSKSVMTDDDNNAHDQGSEFDLWDPDFVRLYAGNQIPVPSKRTNSFSVDTDLNVTRVEAHYLKQKFAASETGDDVTVISHVFENDNFEPAPYPWLWEYPDQLQFEIHHSEMFSMLTKISTLVYYDMLNQLRLENGHDGTEVNVRESIDLWWETARQELVDWKVGDFIGWITKTHSSRGGDIYFINKLHEQIRNTSTSEGFLESKSVQQLIRDREKDKRPNKRRLRPGRFLTEWRLPTRGDRYFADPYHCKYQLDYRAGIASTIVSDIFEGL